jgi:hypothetical protein
VKSVIASQAIYYLTPLAMPPGTMQFINKIERAFLWSAKDTTTGAKCKVNWELVCRPKKYGGLGVLHMEKFAAALRLRWPWLEWKDPTKNWIGSGNPCTNEDMDLFYAATCITLGDGKKTPFWHAPWLDGTKPIDVAPLIYESSKRKNWKVAQALHQDAWIAKIDLQHTFSLDHFMQFVDLWTRLTTIHLNPGVSDEISWKLTANGLYSTKSAYEMRFFGSTTSSLNKMVWKAWAPPKINFFACLANQNRHWTSDRLVKRGWPNCGPCPLCKQCVENVDHLFVHCRFTTRLWTAVEQWLDISEDVQHDSTNFTISEWWQFMAGVIAKNRKAMASITLLVSWEVWNERIDRVFRNKNAPLNVVIDRVKREARLLVIAGAKMLGGMMSGE